MIPETRGAEAEVPDIVSVVSPDEEPSDPVLSVVVIRGWPYSPAYAATRMLVPGSE